MLPLFCWLAATTVVATAAAQQSGAATRQQFDAFLVAFGRSSYPGGPAEEQHRLGVAMGAAESICCTRCHPHAFQTGHDAEVGRE